MNNPRPALALLLAAAAAGFAAPAARAAEPDWLVDPLPFLERRTRLPEIAVHRYVVRATDARVLERRYLFTAGGLLAPAGDFEVPVGVTIPEAAFDKLLIPASAWLAYGRLGPQALANFELVNDLTPLVIADRWQYEVRRAANAHANVGTVANLSTLAEARPGTPAIAGFVVDGRARTVLVRAIGPGLAPFGVTNPLAALRLQLFHDELGLASNDNWATNPAHATLVTRAAERAGAFPLQTGFRDAALAITLNPGTYTVHAVSLGTATGAVLLEIYPLD